MLERIFQLKRTKEREQIKTERNQQKLQPTNEKKQEEWER